MAALRRSLGSSRVAVKKVLLLLEKGNLYKIQRGIRILKLRVGDKL